MRPLPVLAIFVVLAAGCTSGAPAAGSTPIAPAPAGPCDGVKVTRSEGGSPDRSKETIDIALEADGAFVVDVPLPVSTDGTSFAEWAANLTRSGNVATSTVALPEGKVLRITGSGDVRIHSCSVQEARGGNDCCAEAYLNAKWTTERPGDDWRSIRVHGVSGSATLNLTWLAASSWCGREGTYLGPVQAGWQQVPRADGEAWCE